MKDGSPDLGADPQVDAAHSIDRASAFRLLCRAQLRVGLLGFGGPLATMAMMRSELVQKHRLVSQSRYLEGLGVVKLLPGPVSTLLAVFLGQEIAGPWGGLCSGLLFILPSFLALLLIAVGEEWLARWASGPVAQLGSSALSAVQVAVVGIILFTCFHLWRDAFRRRYAGVERGWEVTLFTALAFVCAWRHVPELIILLGCAALGVLWQSLRKGPAAPSRRELRVDPFTLLAFFFVAGLTVFGTGYMVLPYLQRVLVEERAWLGIDSFLRAVAYGNLTPGPVVIASTYMGYAMGGLSGALAATAGMFGGPILLMLALGPPLKRVLGRGWVEAALMGLLPAVAATIAWSLVSLGRNLDWRPLHIALAALALILSLRGWAAWRSLLLAGVVGGVWHFVAPV